MIIEWKICNRLWLYCNRIHGRNKSASERWIKASRLGITAEYAPFFNLYLLSALNFTVNTTARVIIFEFSNLKSRNVEANRNEISVSEMRIAFSFGTATFDSVRGWKHCVLIGKLTPYHQH
ncbi:hypothetical protein T12_12573 [Trichinella patagoniensis]|uniref:Uncharacterized protein n=1 Tax=Trichinella patagoniensis TaxID=990121 RepID=A0A0V0ZVN2_9BILA|nr:hypothetical protein T12_12573 [Trichinella patagoniensis]